MYLSRQIKYRAEEANVAAANNFSTAKKASAVPPFQMLAGNQRAMPARSPVIQRTPGNKASLKPAQTNNASDKRAADVKQFKLENTRKNKKLYDLQSAVESYATSLSNAVENARSMVATKYFVHIPAVDGYMQNFVDNFDIDNNKFTNEAAVPRQAGYWIESYVTKIVRPSVTGELNILLQAKRGNSRPDVILQHKGEDVAWLDITSTLSEGHIYDKNSDGWKETPYVTEVTYEGLKVIALNKIKKVPDAKSQNLGELIKKANEAKEQQELWELKVVAKYGKALAEKLFETHLITKNAALTYESYLYGEDEEEENMDEKEEDLKYDEEEFDELYSPDIEGNRYEKNALQAVEKFTGKKITARELASVVMYWDAITKRLSKLYKGVSEYKLPLKPILGLSWAKDASSADGEPVMRDLFPV